MKRTALRRTGNVKRRWKGGLTVDELASARMWRYDLGFCALRGVAGHECDGPVDGHHVLTRQALRKRGLSEHQWDRRNRLTLCRAAHDAHHNRSQPIPFSLLPEAALGFADELGLLWLVERVYPEAPDAA